MQKSVNQLINFFVPEHYDLLLDIDRVGRRFSGVVLIVGQIVGDEIRLHAKDLEITQATINGAATKVKKYENDEIGLAHKQDSLVCEIEIQFSGVINDGSMHGLYPCHYDFDGAKKELLATQFESHCAREVFPCVDEPAAKATFDLTLITETGVEVLSNMPALDCKLRACKTNSQLQAPSLQDSQKQTTKFATTPKMSTYLLAFVIGNLQKKTAHTKSGVEVNVYATPAQESDSLDFALDVAVRAIDFYNDYFGTKYPLSKSDQVALPDFQFGAMENWGLVTYRETALLAAPNAAISSKQYIATVIAHELSHQWFGDLVTMKWWNDLWLNESFASLMEHIATDALFPGWDMWQTFETSDVIAALRRDALAGVQSVRQDVHHPDEISTLFDSAIVYAKGERLLKMLRAFIGEKSFRAGLKQYFKKFAYQNTTADDLWQCLSAASDQDVAALMTPWLTRPGYPVVTAELDEEKEIKLHQRRFFAEKTEQEKSYRAVIVDLDGTVIDSPEQKIPSAKMQNSARKLLASGVQIFAATGRAMSFAKPVLDNFPTGDYAIVAGGTRIIDPKTYTVVWSCDLTSRQVKEVAKILRRLPYKTIWNDYTEDDYLNGGWDFADFDENQPACLIEIAFVPEKDARKIVKELNQIDGVAATFLHSLKADLYDIHITNARATKEHAIHELARLSGIPTNEMIGVGDGLNDVHIFNAVGRKVAMGNAMDELREMADLVIGDVKDDGLADYFDGISGEFGKAWPIPLFASDQNAPKLLDTAKTTFTPSNPEDFQLNVGNNTHFITAYDDNLRAGLVAQIPKLTPTDRAKILNELLLLAQPGLSPTTAILDILPAYANETNDAVWDIMSLALGTIGRFVEPDSADEKRLKQLAGNLARGQYKRLGWRPKPHEPAGDTRLRATIISQMIYSEDRATIDRALAIYSRDKHELSKIDGDLRPVILAAAVRHGDADEFAYLLDIYKSSPNADLKQDICSALTSTRDQTRIDETLSFLDKIDIVKPQDIFYWYAYLLANRRARGKTWAWVRANWPWVVATFGGDKSYDMFPRYAGNRLQTRAELTEFDDFFSDKKDEPALSRAIAVGHTDIAARVEWLERDGAAVLERLKEIG